MSRIVRATIWVLLIVWLSPVAQASDDPQRAVEIQVELAWLSDPLVCPYYPCARAEGNQLQIEGYVPSEAVHSQALRLARAACRLAVVDQLKIHPGLAVRREAQPADQVMSAAAIILKHDFPDEHAHFLLGCLDNGQLTVSGTVKSVEQKLKLSQSLRRLRGVSYVVNQAQVAGATATALSQPSPWPPPNPVPTVYPPQEPSAAPVEPQLVLGPGVTALPPPASHLPAAHELPLVVRDPTPTEYEPQRLATPVSVQPAPAAPTAVENASTSNRVDPWAGVLPSADASRWVSREHVATPLAPRPAPPVAATSPARSAGEPYVSEGMVRPLAPTPLVAPVQTQPVLTLEQLAARLQQWCGTSARQLSLQLVGGNRLRVWVIAVSEGEVDRLANIVLGVPELAGYQVELSINVGG